MLDNNIINRLENISDLPTIPVVLSEVLDMLNKEEVKSKDLVEAIERDPMLTTKILRVANSPYYGFSRKISTVELAIALIGMNTIKEIAIGLMVKKIFLEKSFMSIDVKEYWKYLLFSAVATKYFAAKLEYRPIGEAFVTGLMHDIGILIIQSYFRDESKKIIISVSTDDNKSLIDAENQTLDTNHAEIGAWLAEKWNLPKKMCEAIKNHHYDFRNTSDNDLVSDQPLTTAVSLSEYFADLMGFMDWNPAEKQSKLFIGEEVFKNSGDGLLDKESTIQKIKQDLLIEFDKIELLNII